MSKSSKMSSFKKVFSKIELFFPSAEGRVAKVERDPIAAQRTQILGTKLAPETWSWFYIIEKKYLHSQNYYYQSF